MARPRWSLCAARGCTAISRIATDARSEMITPVHRDSARSHVKPRNPIMVLHRSEVKEIRPLAVSQFAMSAANPTLSVIQAKRGL